MNRTEFNSAAEIAPIRIEQVFAEKPAGGLVVDPGFDCPETTAVSKNSDGKYEVIKGYRLVKAVTATDTSIQIAKGSGVAKGDVLGYGSVAVACTAVNTNNSDYDVVTVKMGVAIDAGEVLYEAAAASADAATVKATPVYVLGDALTTGLGEQPLRLIVGATLRKETACIGKDVASALGTIKLV